MIASDIMKPELMTIGPEESLLTAIQKLYVHRIAALAVCDETGKLLGTVSEKDLLAAQNAVLAKAMPVSVVMTSPAASVTMDARLREIVNVFVQQGVKQVLVVQEERAVGIITRLGVLQALISMSAAVE